MEFLITALTLGFLGSLHCVGMCGPIAMAVPVVNKSFAGRLGGIVLYNGGRAITYALLGVVFGLFGRSFILAGYQQALSIIVGVIILLFVLVPQKYLQQAGFGTGIAAPFNAVKKQLSTLFKIKSYPALLSIGVLNGLLPCGLVYTAIAGAVATADPLSGSLFMAFFGLGTIPAMVVLMLTGQKVSLQLRNSFKKVVPVFVSAMAVLLILRGLNLGIPYLSPELDRHDCTKHHCCIK